MANPITPQVKTIKQVLNSFGQDCSFRTLTGNEFEMELAQSIKEIQSILDSAKPDTMGYIDDDATKAILDYQNNINERIMGVK